MTTVKVPVRSAGGVLADLTPKHDDRDPGWLAEARLNAVEWVGKNGFPSRKDEDWRYTALHGILAVPCEATVLAASPDRLKRFFGHTPGEHHAFAAFNDVFAEDGAFIHLTSNTIVDEPIQLVFFSDTEGVPMMPSPRSVIVADAGSRATIIETYAGIENDIYFTDVVTEVVLVENAQIDHYKVQNEPTTAFHLALLDVRQACNSRFASRSVMLGESVARREIRMLLEGVEAEVSLDGIYLPQGEQVHDNTIFVDHVATDCTSHQLYTGVLYARGHGGSTDTSWFATVPMGPMRTRRTRTSSSPIAPRSTPGRDWKFTPTM